MSRTRIDSQGDGIFAVLAVVMAIVTSILMAPVAVAGKGRTWGLVLLLLFLLPAAIFAFLGVAFIANGMLAGLFGYALFVPLIVEAGGIYLWIRKRKSDRAQ